MWAELVFLPDLSLTQDYTGESFSLGDLQGGGYK